MTHEKVLVVGPDIHKQALLAKLQAMQAEGLEFSDVMAVFGKPVETNPYLKVAFGYQEEGEVELDDLSVVSPAENGAYVLMWHWVSIDDALEQGYKASGTRLSDMLEPLVDAGGQQDSLLIREYALWLEETLTNFSDEIDGLELQEFVRPESEPEPLHWVPAALGLKPEIRFRPSEAIRELLTTCPDALEAPVLNTLQTWLAEQGPTLDVLLRMIPLPLDSFEL